jgi:6-phosphogluconolactonase (cycloisomerase 2 family)
MMRNFRRLSRNYVPAVFGMLLAGSSVLFGQINLYVPNNNNAPPNVSEYGISSANGALTVVPGQPTTTTDNNPSRVAMTPNSKFLYIISANGYVDAYSVAPTGLLTVIQAQPGYTVASPTGIVATNNYVYVSSGAGQIYVFSINPTSGALTTLTCAACSIGGASNAQAIVLDPTNTYLYVALPGTNAIGIGTIQQSGPNAGTLSSFNATAYSGPANFTPQDLALTPTGGNLYASNFLGPPPFSGTTFITPFTVTGGGTTLTAGSNVTVGSSPNGLAIDPSGKFLYVANQGSGNVSAFTIGAGGALSAVAGSPFASGSGAASRPLGASVDPTGNFLYVSNNADGTVSGWRINTTTGALTAVPGSPYATGTGPYYLLAHLAPAAPTVPAASTWSLMALGLLLAGMAGLLYRKAYR